MSQYPRLSLAIGACLLSGCFVPLVAPRCEICPKADVGETDDEVVAVFVHAVRTHCGTAPFPSETYSFRKAAVVKGEVPSQIQVSIFQAYLLFLYPLYESEEDCLTKLYRRGYKTVVLGSSLAKVKVEWVPAVTPEEREAAVRDLVYGSSVHQPSLSPGSSNRDHQKVLFFAMAEYEEVARLYPPHSDGCLRCIQEAEKIRAIASRKPDEACSTPGYLRSPPPGAK